MKLFYPKSSSNKGYPLPQPLSLPTARSLSREPRELPQTLTTPFSEAGGRLAALISVVQLSSQDQVGRLTMNCKQVLQATPQYYCSQGYLWVRGLPG